MRRAVSILLAFLMAAGSPMPAGAASIGAPSVPISPQPASASVAEASTPASSPGTPAVARGRNLKGILLWGGLFVANSALLSIGARDLGRYKDAGLEAQARGEDPGGYWGRYDRAGWLVAGAAAGIFVSTVGLARAARLRPVVGVPAPGALPLAGVETRLAIDPVDVAIANLERRAAAAAAPADSAQPIVVETVRMQQAWLPGTRVAKAPGAALPAAPIEVAAEPDGPVAAPGEAVATRTQEPPPSGDAIASPPDPIAAIIDTILPPDAVAAPEEVPSDAAGDAAGAAADNPAILSAVVVMEPAPTPAHPAPTPAEPAGPLEGPAPAASPSTPSRGADASPRAMPEAAARTDSPPAEMRPVRATPTPGASTAREYTVQVASHRRPANAEQDAARWTLLGYPAEVVAKDLGARGVWHRVVIGRFDRARDAEALAARIRAQFPAQDYEIVRR